MGTWRSLRISIAVGMALATVGGSTVSGVAEPGLPEGTYRTPELTREQLAAAALEAGFTEEDIDAFLDGDGIEGTVQFALQLAAGGWTQRYAYDGGDEDVGWRGTYVVVDEDTVIATDPCGPITYDYSLDGDELTLDMVDDRCDGGVGELIAQTIIFESSPFTLEAPGEAERVAEPASYASTSFVVPFEVTLPPWVTAEPAAELPNFVTWESDEVDRGVRFLFPLSVYVPGSTSTTDPPEDFAAYLLGQEEYGAVLEDVVETTVDGLPATIVTGTTDGRHLDGSLGCQEQGLAAEDCFGLQPDLILRLAVIETDAGPLLVWVRDIRGADDRQLEYESFDEMLASLRFVGD